MFIKLVHDILNDSRQIPNLRKKSFALWVYEIWIFPHEKALCTARTTVFSTPTANIFIKHTTDRFKVSKNKFS